MVDATKKTQRVYLDEIPIHVTLPKDDKNTPKTTSSSADQVLPPDKAAKQKQAQQLANGASERIGQPGTSRFGSPTAVDPKQLLGKAVHQANQSIRKVSPSDAKLNYAAKVDAEIVNDKLTVHLTVTRGSLTDAQKTIITNAVAEALRGVSFEGKIELPFSLG